MGNRSHVPIPILSELDFDRLVEKFEIDEVDKCWPWKGTYDEGYGLFSLAVSSHRRKNYRAHRVVYFVTKGQPGWDVHHLCETPGCVNPSHLVCVTDDNPQPRHRTPADNKCRNGHEFTVENTYYRPDNGMRQCRQCGVEASARHRRKRDDQVSITRIPWPASLDKATLLERVSRESS